MLAYIYFFNLKIKKQERKGGREEKNRGMEKERARGRDMEIET